MIIIEIFKNCDRLQENVGNLNAYEKNHTFIHT